MQKNVAEILVSKHRNGPTGLVKLYFKGECTKFLNLDEETGEIDDENQDKPQSKVSVSGYEPLPDESPMPSDADVPFDDGTIIKTVDDEIF